MSVMPARLSSSMRVLHARLVENGHQRFGAVRGQGPQARPLSARHDNGFHERDLLSLRVGVLFPTIANKYAGRHFTTGFIGFVRL